MTTWPLRGLFGVTDADPAPDRPGVRTRRRYWPRCGPNAWTSGPTSGLPGLLGVAFLPLLPIMAVIVMVSNDLFRGFLFSEPLFQTLPIYVLLPAGDRRGPGLAGPAVAQDRPWSSRFCSWPRRSAGQRYGRRGQCPVGARASCHGGDAGRGPEARSRRQDAVFASQGVVGRFSGTPGRAAHERAPAHLAGGGLVHLHPLGRHRDAETSGRRWCSRDSSRARCTPGSCWTRTGYGYSAWTPPPGVHRLTVPAGATAAARVDRPRGRRAGLYLPEAPATWHVTSTGQAGYVADRLEWARLTGRFQAASVTLAHPPLR